MEPLSLVRTTSTTASVTVPQSLEEAEVYLAKPSTRQILDFYASSDYLYETAWAYQSLDQKPLSEMFDEPGKPEDILRSLPADDILEIHDVLNVEQHNPGVIQWDELENGELDAEKTVHWVTATDIRLIGKLFNKSGVSENLWTQAILGLKKEVVDRLLAKARNKDKAKKRRMERRKQQRRKAKKQQADSVQSMQNEGPAKSAQSNGIGHGPAIEQVEELARVATNGSTSSQIEHKHRGKKRRRDTAEQTAEDDTPMTRESEKGSTSVEQAMTRRARQRRKRKEPPKPSREETTVAENGESVNADLSIIPLAQTENGSRQGDDNDWTHATNILVEQQVKLDPTKETSTEAASCVNLASRNKNDVRDSERDVLITECSTPSSPHQNQNVDEKLPLREIAALTILSPRTTRSSSRTKSPLESPYFITDRPDSVSPSKGTPKGTSCIRFPPLSAPSFGLIQETLAHNPFHLLIAVQFLNKTRGSAALPVIQTLISLYPTPDMLAAADPAVIVPLIRHLGLQNQRAKKLVDFAKMWVACPPERGKRYRTLDYPRKGAGKNIKKDEVIADEEDDAREGAWEVAHLPGVGAYALDSWRIFCRDVLRGVAQGWNGQGTSEDEKEAAFDQRGTSHFEPEWQRTLPLDKELRAFLRWKWLQRHKLCWNPLTGKTVAASQEILDKVIGGDCIAEELDHGSNVEDDDGDK